MKPFLCGVLISLVATVAGAQSADNESSDLTKRICILNAAERLPKIPGLNITSAEIHLAKATPSHNDLLVDINIRAAGIEAKYVFICAAVPGKPAFVSLIGIK